MKKYFLTVFLILIMILANGQTKTIRGKVIHSRSKAPVAKVHIYSEGERKGVLSDPRGIYTIKVPRDYFRTITYERPGYYPYQLRVLKGSNVHPNYVQMVPDTIRVDTFCYPSFPENRYLVGEVFEKKFRNAVDMAVIRLPDGKILDYTNHEGYFETGIPDTSETILITKDGYAGIICMIERGNRSFNTGKVYITLLDEEVFKDFWTSNQNALSFMINELITGSVGICYERFLHLRHSVGVKTSAYLFGRGYIPLFSVEESRFTGIKVSPMYRFYFWRNMNAGYFCEGKFTWGYFNLYELYYSAAYSGSYRGFYSQEKTMVYGFGTAVGLSRQLGHGHLNLNFSIGTQYLPLNITQTKIYEAYGGLTCNVDDVFWYFGGPGSFIEIKFILGGLF